MHPPARYLARPFAERGAEVVPYLRIRLAETKNELTLRDIAAILVELKQLENYDFSEDNIVDMLDEKEKSMRGPWKNVVRSMVDDLK
jgi:hypothetical protein